MNIQFASHKHCLIFDRNTLSVRWNSYGRFDFNKLSNMLFSAIVCLIDRVKWYFLAIKADIVVVVAITKAESLFLQIKKKQDKIKDNIKK